jgi:hypothetical protein
MTQESLIQTPPADGDVPVTEVIDQAIETDTQDAPAETPAENADTDAVFNDMIPLFKQLNLDEDTARTAVDRLISGGDIGDLVDDQGLIFGKYKDSVTAQDAFKKLESENGRLRREKAPTAPDEYEYSFADDDDLKGLIDEEWSAQDDPMMKSMDPVFKEMNLTQEQVNGLVKAHMMYEASQAPNREQEIEKLGSNAAQITEEVGSFVGRNFSEDEQDILHQTASTAAGVKLLHKLSKLSQGQKSIPSGEAAMPARKSSAELYQEAFAVKKEAGANFSNNTTALKLYEEKLDKAVEAENKGY